MFLSGDGGRDVGSGGVCGTVLTCWRGLLQPATVMVVRLPRRRLDVGGSGLIFGLPVTAVVAAAQLPFSLLFRFWWSDATSRTLDCDADAEASCMPRFLIILGLVL